MISIEKCVYDETGNGRISIYMILDREVTRVDIKFHKYNIVLSSYQTS